MIHRIGDKTPRIDGSAFIAWNAEVAGDVTLGEDVSVWFGAAIRADHEPITVGNGSNIQENATIHIDRGAPARIGERVTIGHNAVVHGCTVGDGCLIGIGAVVLTGAELGEECLVGAGALVTEGKMFPPRSLVIGVPARAIRTLTEEELVKMRDNAADYVELGRKAAEEYREVR